MSTVRQKFSSQVDSEVLKALKTIARDEGRQFQSVLEQAMREFIERKKSAKPRDTVMANFRVSLEKNRRLGELLAK